MKPFVHKSIGIRPEVWKRLRIHAELSDTSLRDYLSYLIERSEPVDLKDTEGLSVLQQVSVKNRQARDAAVSHI